jgi:hypothetical protein
MISIQVDVIFRYNLSDRQFAATGPKIIQPRLTVYAKMAVDSATAVPMTHEITTLFDAAHISWERYGYEQLDQEYCHE